MAASNQAFSAFSFLSFVLTAIPFTWHLQSWNIGMCIYMGWISLCSLVLFINSVVWNGNVVNWAPVYCDIVAKFYVGVAVSIPAGALCITRRLYHIVSVKTVTRTVVEKRREVLIDLAIGIGIPVIIMALHVVVQGHRFNIYEDVGCWPSVCNVSLTYILILGPKLVLAIIACIYSILSLIALKHNYLESRKLLSSNGTNQAAARRYIKLMCLAGLEAFVDVPYNVYVIVEHAKEAVPWRSWKDIHHDFNRIDVSPAILWRNNPGVAQNLERTRWMIVVWGFIFFAFFGFADEAIKTYKFIYNIFARKLGLRLAHISGMPPAWGARLHGGEIEHSGGAVTSFCGNKNRRNKKTLANDSSENNGDLESKGAGTETWMTSFDVFAEKVKLVIPQSPVRTSSPNPLTIDITRNNTCGENASPNLSAVCMTRPEMVQKVDAHSMNMGLADFERPRPIENLETENAYSGSLPVISGSTGQLRPSSPLSPPSPQPNPICSSPFLATSLTVPAPVLIPRHYYHYRNHHLLSTRRATPRHTIRIETSVSDLPTPGESFLGPKIPKERASSDAPQAS